MRELLTQIIASPPLHAKWLNTLSYLENCGARKLAACEHPTLVREEMLKHAAEEFRHAHYLKRQIARVTTNPLQDYSLPNLLGGVASLHYLHALDLHACRLLGSYAPTHAYILVTYAIELRAQSLYPMYDLLLRQVKSPVTVRSILLEEQEHLNEMRGGIAGLPYGKQFAGPICAIEERLYHRWLTHLAVAVQSA